MKTRLKTRFAPFALFLALLAGVLVAPLSASAQAAPATGPFDVTGDLVNGRGRVIGDFSGTVSNLVVTVNRQGQLLVSGDIEGQATRTGQAAEPVSGSFRQVVSRLLNPGGTCTILNLDIGRINLNLLGLVIDLAPISLDVTGQTGSGQLLGNLLCALVRLLD